MTAPTTTRSFKSRAIAGFRKANPEATGVTITWLWASKVTFPTGAEGFSGTFRVEADGYRARNLLATYVDGGGMMVR